MNPAWLRSPFWRALFMFQPTPFKIMERRIVNGMRAGRAISNMGKAVYQATKTAEGRAGLYSDMQDIWKHMKGAEREWKANVLIDNLRSEQDFFGGNMISQFAKDIAIVGAALTGGAYAGLNLKHHFFHIPFISGYTHEPTMQFSPGVMALLRGYRDWKRNDDEDEEFLFTKVAKKWLGPHGPLPGIFRKIERLSDEDIPEIYRDSKFQYFFAIPSWKEEK